METNIDAILEEAATAVEASGAGTQKKERKPKADVPKVAKEPKAPKEPKEKLYVQWNEDGSPMMDAEGNRVKLPTKMDRPKREKAEGSGGVRNAISDDTVLILTDKVAAFREGSHRHTHYTTMAKSTTAGEFFAASGGRGVTGTFLAWFVKEGFVTLGEKAE